MPRNQRRRTLLATLGSLLCTGAVTAQTLSVSGTCPGPMTFEVTGATPEGKVAMLTGDERGTDLVPGGRCAGGELEVTGNLERRAFLTADAAGDASRTAFIPQAVCGSWLQAYDVGSCAASNAEVIRFAEPDSIDVSCVPASNPLRAGCTVTVDPPQPVEVRYARADGMGVERANRGERTAGTHQVPLLFLAPQSDYQVEAVALGHPQGLSATDTLTTGMPPFHIDSWLSPQGESTIGLVGGELPCADDAVAVIYDTGTGDLVWYDDLDPNGIFGVLDMVQYTDEQTVLGETGCWLTDGRSRCDGQPAAVETSVVEVDLLGRVITDFNVSYPGCCNLHHDIFTANDLYYGFYADTVEGVTLDPVVVLDPRGEELFEWNPRDHLPVPPDASGDWLHTNSVYVEEDGTVLLSWLGRDSVAKIDLAPSSPTFGDVLWIMGGDPPDALPSDISIDWSAVPGPDSFSRQHNFHRRHDGRFMLLDNLHGRGVVFTIDEESHTATADAVYPTVESSCGAQGTADDTEAGNALVGCMTEFLREYDGVTGQLIWQSEILCANGGGGFFGTASARWYALDGWSKAFLPTPQ